MTQSSYKMNKRTFWHTWRKAAIFFSESENFLKVAHANTESMSLSFDEFQVSS